MYAIRAGGVTCYMSQSLLNEVCVSILRSADKGGGRGSQSLLNEVCVSMEVTKGKGSEVVSQSLLNEVCVSIQGTHKENEGLCRNPF